MLTNKVIHYAYINGIHYISDSHSFSVTPSPIIKVNRKVHIFPNLSCKINTNIFGLSKYSSSESYCKNHGFVCRENFLSHCLKCFFFLNYYLPADVHTTDCAVSLGGVRTVSCSASPNRTLAFSTLCTPPEDPETNTQRASFKCLCV